MDAEYKGCPEHDALNEAYAAVCKERDELLAAIRDYEKECENLQTEVARLNRENFEQSLVISEAEKKARHTVPDYNELFDELRKNRVEVSYFKYGPAKKNFGEGRVDAIKTADLCLEAFRRDKNTEHLVDAANYLMFRFAYPLPGEHFEATDSSRSVGTVGTPINME